MKKNTGFALIVRMICCCVACLSFTGSYGKEIITGPAGQNNIQVMENTYQVLRISNSLMKFDAVPVKTDHGIYTRISIPGYTSSVGLGSPDLPVMRKLIEVPVDAQPVVTIIHSSYTEYQLDDLGFPYPIMPVQAPRSKSNIAPPQFVIDNQAYQQNSFSPANLVTVEVLGYMRGERLGRLNINPVQYNPVTRTIRIYNILEVRVSFPGANLALSIEKKLRNDSPYFMSVNKLVFNYKAPNATASNFTKYPVKYVIVAAPMFQAMLQPFIAWKKKKGFNVIEAYTNNPNVGTTTTSIKNYLQGLYQAGTVADPAPSFVLLVGDVAEVPSFPGTTNTHVSDLYYADYTNDHIPDVFIGRFSAESESDLAPQLSKTLEYEQFLMPDPSFLNQVVMIAGVDPNCGPTYGNGQINYGTSNYFNSSFGITSHTYLYPASGNSAAQIIQDVSNGVGFANYTAHGSPDGWANPGFSISDIAGLQNAHKYPLMVGNCCLSNKFDDPICFGEALLRASDKGAVGYIGASNSSYWDEDYWWGIGVRAISPNPVFSASEPEGAYDLTFHSHGEPFNQWFMTQGQMVVAGNLGVTIGSPSSELYYWEIYHLMGDPSLMIYYSVPPAMTVSHSSLMPLNSTTFTVNANPHTYVAISKNGVLYGVGLTDSLGVCNMTLNPISIPGYANIVITGQNLIPYIDSLLVDSPAGPYVMLNNYLVHDSLGNNNGLADFAETISLPVTLKNYGQGQGNNITATLTSSDPYITIITNSHSWGNIAIGASAFANDAYTFSVANNIPDQHQVVFNLNIHDNSGNNWNTSFHITVNAPSFSVMQLAISDNAGNGDGCMDAGENVQLSFTSRNIGHAAAPGTLGQLNSPGTGLSLQSSSVNLNTVAPGGIVNATFNATVSSAVIPGSEILLNYSIASGAYQAQKSYLPVVGHVSETWESGTLTSLAWQVEGPAPWFITNQGPYQGLDCARSGVIIDGETTSLFINTSILAQDSISFYRKVSSEPSYDLLGFYNNGIQQEQWSGEVPWGRVSYIVTPGEHTFKWSYAKDPTISSGSDAAWIDFINFPPLGGVVNVNELAPLINPWNIFPNPSKGNTSIVFYLEKSAKVTLKVMNAIGQDVNIILNEAETAGGQHMYYFDSSLLSKGMYFCTFTCGDHRSVKKLIVN